MHGLETQTMGAERVCPLLLQLPLVYCIKVLSRLLLVLLLPGTSVDAFQQASMWLLSMQMSETKMEMVLRAAGWISQSETCCITLSQMGNCGREGRVTRSCP